MSEDSTDVVRLPVQAVAPSGDLDLKAAHEAWRNYLADKAELTRENYGRDLQAFAEFVGHPDGQTALAWLFSLDGMQGNQAIHGYYAHLLSVRIGEGDEQQIGFAPSTVRRRISAIRAVVKRARRYNLVSWEVDLELPSVEPLVDTRGPGPAQYGDVLAALDSAIATARDADDSRQLEIALRDRVIVRLLHDSGLRRSECIGIEWPRGVRLDNEPSVLVLGKGRRRHRWVAISTPCRDQIREYLVVRGRRAGYLVTGTGARAAGKMNRGTVNRRVAHWGDVAGVSFTPHGLRHTATTTALDHEKGNKRIVKQWSRHRAEASLDPYDDRRRQDGRRLAEILSDPSQAEPHS